MPTRALAARRTRNVRVSHQTERVKVDRVPHVPNRGGPRCDRQPRGADRSGPVGHLIKVPAKGAAMSHSRKHPRKRGHQDGEAERKILCAAVQAIIRAAFDVVLLHITGKNQL